MGIGEAIDEFVVAVATVTGRRPIAVVFDMDTMDMFQQEIRPYLIRMAIGGTPTYNGVEVRCEWGRKDTWPPAEQEGV